MNKCDWKKETIEKAMIGSENYKDILLKLNIVPCTSSYYRLKKYMSNYSLLFNSEKKIIDKWTKENISEKIKISNSKSELIYNLGLTSKGDNFKTLEKYIKMYDLNVDFLEKNYFKNKKELNEILVENSTYQTNHLKERLYKEGLKKRECEMCGQGEIWKGKRMSLILDHINGINNDNRFENLRIVCPNCNSTLPTHCRKNK